MIAQLAYAAPPDLSANGWIPVLIGTGVIAAISVLVAIPIIILRRRQRPVEALSAVLIVWGILAAGSIAYTVYAQMQWNQQYDDLIKTGYYDPQNTSGAPVWPWWLWLILAAIYGALLIFAILQKSPPGDSA